MKVTKRLLLLGLLVALLLIAGSIVTSAQTSDSSGMFRFVHVVPDVGEVDIYTNGQLTITGLGYGEGTEYIQAPIGTHTITARARGVATDLWSQEITVDVTPLTLIASNAQSPIFEVYNDDLATLEVGQSRLMLIHAIADGPTVALTINGDEVAPEFAYPQSIGTFDVPAGFYSLGATATNGTVVASDAPLNQNSGTSQFAILYGTANAPAILTLAASTSDSNSSLVRIAHTVAGAPDVDIYANDVLIVSGLTFGDATSHLPIPAGDYTVDIRVTTTTESIFQTDLTVETDSAITVAATGTLDSLNLSVFNDDISGVTEDTAVISVINAIPGNSTVIYALDDGTSISSGITFGEADLPVSVSPTIDMPTVDFSVDGQSATLEQEEVIFYGGVYYNAIAVTGTMFSPPLILFFPTSIAQGIASAPATADAVVIADVPTPEAEQPTEAPVEVQATEVPVVAPTVPVVGEDPLPTGRILLDPGVNLQLRQFPSSEALSLGLAPSGSTVVVNGREGAPIDILTGEELIEEGAEPFVDPATLLESEDDDLVADATWVNFTYPTPDGGTITAWTLAIFLEIRDEDNELVRIADLPTVPNNQPGEASNTEITPPAEQEDRLTAVVINLEPTANLNMRRNPSATSEVLARLPVGTVVDFIGVLEARDWAFVSYSPAEGGTITGWVSTQFIDYQLNGELSNLEEFETLQLLTVVSEETLGEVSAGAPPVTQPTADPEQDAYIAEVALDPGANLNLRRTPDAQSEVLARIPSGTRVIITARTADAGWLFTTFEGVSGWVAADFVIITYNGEFVADITEIPIATDQTEVEPTATPES